MNKGVIVHCKEKTGQYLSPYFLVSKPNGEYRFILNLKGLNKFIKTDHFKMHDLRTVLKLILQDDFMASIDLQDAYFLVSVDKSCRKYLRFKFQNNIYEFTVLPFGLCTSPYVFTKILKPVMSQLRMQGLMSVDYLDDILLIGKNYEECFNNVKLTRSLLESLGFVLNEKKCKLSPSKQCRFLGFEINSHECIVFIPEEKKIKILNLIKKMISKSDSKVREVAQLIGNLVAACPGVRYGWAHIKTLEREKELALIFNRMDYERKMLISTRVKTELNWWVENLPEAFSSFKNTSIDKVIFTDASTSGWGAVLENKEIHGFWTEKEKREHINLLELKAIWLALLSFETEIKNCHILLRVDNTTAISYINKMGGIKYQKFNRIAAQIWHWAEKNNIWLHAEHIPSKQNLIADRLSRLKNVDTEWELNEYAFREITNVFGFPEIDLFATNVNSKCKKFCSWITEPDAWAIDAFSISWSEFYFYAFPPFSMILRTLNKIVQDKARGILIVPDWKAQAWYPLFKKLLEKEPLKFKPSQQLLLSPCRSVIHPRAQNLTLLSSIVSGKLI